MAPFQKIGEAEEGQEESQQASNADFLSSSEDEECERLVTKIAKLTSKRGVSRSKPQNRSQESTLPPLPPSSMNVYLLQALAYFSI